MPCCELFDKQSLEYQLQVHRQQNNDITTCISLSLMMLCEQVFPEGVPVLSVEPATTTCWLKYANATHGMSTFGASAPGGKVITSLK
jgi:transketolase